ncbi:phosphomannomutase/phosphoglucomutase [Candidatus Parcubacteria bacterium]|nr:phosphomannomutase/phosphoglucomutase [Candidatus Parcubacteria bacterium]
MAKIDPYIFRAYDIRGIYPTRINEEFAYKLGKSFATLNPGKIVVGRDCRIGGESLKKELVKGLTESGAEVIDIGIIPTPLVIFSIGYYNFDGGISITASHNPKEYQGFLLYNKEGVGIGKENGLEEIKELIHSEKFKEGRGLVKEKTVLEDYINFISKKITLRETNKKIVIDCGNGVISTVLFGLLDGFNIKYYPLFCELDGNFPNREPEPKKDNLQDLQKKVIAQKADCGFAYDADADRIVAVDENGKILNPAQLFSILIKSYLENKKEKVIHDSLSSSAIDEIIKYYKGLPIGCRVGHVFIQKKLLESNAVIGGEISGHYFFREIFGADDAAFATLKVLEYLEKKKIKLSEAYKDVPNYYFNSMRVKTREKDKFKFIEDLTSKFKKKYKLDCLDGVKIILKDSWALFRASNTDPKISIAYESKTKQEFKKLEKFVYKIVKRIPK